MDRISSSCLYMLSKGFSLEETERNVAVGGVFHSMDIDTDAMIQKSQDLLVAITDEEVGVQLLQVQGDLTDTMRAVDQTEDAVFLAHLGDSLKGEADSRDRHDGLEDADLGRQAVVQDPRNRLRQRIEDFGVGAWQGVGKVLTVADLA